MQTVRSRYYFHKKWFAQRTGRYEKIASHLKHIDLAQGTSQKES